MANKDWRDDPCVDDLLLNAKYGAIIHEMLQRSAKDWLARDPDLRGMDMANLEKRWIEHMSQQYIIDGEWSQYHHMVSATKGWGLSQVQGMWSIVTTDTQKFPTNEEARQHVLACELDTQCEEYNLAQLAINAIMVGNVRG